MREKDVPNRRFKEKVSARTARPDLAGRAMQSVTAENANLRRIMKRLYHAIPAQRKGSLRLDEVVDERDLGINAGI